MRDLFISPRKILRESWQLACPEAQIYNSVSAVRLSKKESYFFWLHADADSQQWVANCVQEIIQRFPQSRIVVLANVPDQRDALLSLSYGVTGYCHALSAPELLLQVRNAVLSGGIWLGRDLLQSLIAATTSLVGNKPDTVASHLAQLTKREQQVAIQASKGLSNKEIAKVLKITERTVKAHLSSAFERLGVRDRLQLALILNEKSEG